MKVIIAGSRELTDVALVDEAVRRSGFAVGTVISGMAPGIDRAGQAWAAAHGIPVVEMPANWERDGRGAGYRRNAEMAALADACIVIWTGDAASSPDSRHLQELAQKHDLPLFVLRPEAWRALTPADLAHVDREVGFAQRAIARYNTLHTLYWQAVAAAPDPRTDAGVAEAHAKLEHARPVLLQILANAQATAQLADWGWPGQPVAPWIAAPIPPDLLPPQRARSPTRRARALPTLPAITPTTPPAAAQALSQAQATIAAARTLGKGPDWAPLRHALAEVRRALAPTQLTLAL